MTGPETTQHETTTQESSGYPSFGTVVSGLILLALGMLWLLDELEVLNVRLALVVPIALGVVGLSLMLGAFRGSHPGLVTLGVFLTIATLLISFFPVGFRGGIGERNVRVTEMSQLDDRYDMALGKIEIDMSDLDLTESAAVEMSVGAGEIQVRVPENVALKVEASVAAGEIIVRDRTSQGLTPSLDYESEGFATAPVTLTLRINVGAGKIEVR